jgi:biotin-dependent carboxylase-like uncharacterized protein
VSLRVVAASAGTSVQGLERFGYSAVGVSPGGATDRGALRLANRLVGNPQDAAGIEVLLGGLVIEAGERTAVAVTGAAVTVSVNGRVTAFGAPLALQPGDRLALATPASGLRSFVAVRGGVRRARPFTTDALHGGMELHGAGQAVGPLASSDLVPPSQPAEDVTLRVVDGPRLDWFAPSALAALGSAAWRVLPDSDRVGVRLEGPALERRRPGELHSEGVVRGSIQVPPSGAPVVLFADHPTTGGYPVIAVVVDADVDRLSEARPGAIVRFARRAVGWR